VRDGQGDGAAARAQVQHVGRLAGRQQVERPVHQGFGVVARVEHARIDLQRQAVEVLAAGEVGHRLAPQAARGQRAEALGARWRQRIAVVRQQPGARVRGLAQRVQQQHPRLVARQAGVFGVAQGVGQGHELLLNI
jgi:hypothetical protein